jgi:hypothetical protein
MTSLALNGSTSEVPSEAFVTVDNPTKNSSSKMVVNRLILLEKTLILAIYRAKKSDRKGMNLPFRKNIF